MRLAPIELARRGEALAATLLEEKGYLIIDRNRRLRGGEIDLIARDGNRVVFVEVKTRSGTAFPPAEGVDGRKQHRLRALARQWLWEEGQQGAACRFDVVAVHMQRHPPYAARAEHLEGAF